MKGIRRHRVIDFVSAAMFANSYKCIREAQKQGLVFCVKREHLFDQLASAVNPVAVVFKGQLRMVFTLRLRVGGVHVFGI
jgi:hypothetical protein